MLVDAFGGEERLSGELIAGRIVRQQFVAKATRLESICVCFATYMRQNACSVKVTLLDMGDAPAFRERTPGSGAAQGGGKVLHTGITHALYLKDNAYHRFRFGLDLRKGALYEIRVYSDNGRSGSSVTAKWGVRQQSGMIPFFIGKQEVMGELACTIEYEDKTSEKAQSREVRAAVSQEGVDGMVSIVIPVHNDGARCLGKCLQHASMQTYNCFEIVVADDGSSRADLTATRDIVRKACGAYGFPISMTRNHKNRGAPSARNLGFARSKGAYVLFLDVDCYLRPYALEWYLNVLHANPNAAYAYCNFELGGVPQKFHKFDETALRQRNYISTMSMIRSGAFPGFDETIQRLQDWDLWLTMLRYGMKGVWVGDKVLFETVYRAGGITKGGSIELTPAYQVVKKKHAFWSRYNKDDQNQDVTVVMVMYKTVDLFRIAYGSLRKFYPALKIVVVDGSGGDSCTKYLDQIERSDPNFMLLKFDYNIGHGRGMHVGIVKAQSEYVLLLDSDTMVKRGGFIEEMKKMMRKETYAVGHVQSVNAGGIATKKDGLPYIHPSTCLLNRWNYMKFQPFQAHGAPCVFAMMDIHSRGLSEKLLRPFDVAEYVRHDWNGTRGKFGMSAGE